MVDADFAELVDHDRGVGPLGPAQQFADQRRLAGAEKAGDDRDRDACTTRPALPPPERARVKGGEGIGGRGRTPTHAGVRTSDSPSLRPSPRKRGEGEFAELTENSRRSIRVAASAAFPPPAGGERDRVRGAQKSISSV